MNNELIPIEYAADPEEARHYHGFGHEGFHGGFGHFGHGYYGGFGRPWGWGGGFGLPFLGGLAVGAALSPLAYGGYGYGYGYPYYGYGYPYGGLWY